MESEIIDGDAWNLAFSSFASPERNPFTAVPQPVFVELGHLPRPSPGSPGVFEMGDASVIRSALGASGFGVQAIETTDQQGSIPDGDFIVDRTVEMNSISAGGIATASGPKCDAPCDGDRIPVCR